MAKPTTTENKQASKNKKKPSCRISILVDMRPYGDCVLYSLYICICMYVCCMTLVNNCLKPLLSKIVIQLSKLYVTIG